MHWLSTRDCFSTIIQMKQILSRIYAFSRRSGCSSPTNSNRHLIRRGNQSGAQKVSKEERANHHENYQRAPKRPLANAP
jgi:hypothetical protein